MTIYKPKVIAVRLSEGEWVAWQHLCTTRGLATQDLLHGVVIDALVDEGYDALRRREPQGCSNAGETVETGEPATEGSHPGNNVCRSGSEVDARVSNSMPLLHDELQRHHEPNGLYGRSERSSDLDINGHNVSVS